MGLYPDYKKIPEQYQEKKFEKKNLIIIAFILAVFNLFSFAFNPYMYSEPILKIMYSAVSVSLVMAIYGLMRWT